MNEKDRIITDYLNDISDSIININDFIKNIDYPAFKEDTKTQYAVIRALEIIGEASKKIPKEVKDDYSWIPWRFMAGMRDKLIHGYFGVDPDAVWETARKDIPMLREKIARIIDSGDKT